MFDSIDFIIESINIWYLKPDIINKVKVNKFTNTNQQNEYTKSGIEFEYQTVKFKYYYKSNALLIHTNAHQILNKKNIMLVDKTEYINKLNDILNTVILDFKNYEIQLIRIDYCVDLKLNEKMNEYINLLNNNIHIFKYMKRNNAYNSSIHLNTKQGKQNINIYDRYEKTHNPNDIGMLRVEIQGKKRLIKGELKKYGISRELDNYWSIDSMEDYFFSIIEGYCYSGDYYKRYLANIIIDNSNYTTSMKEKLKQFLLEVENIGLENVRKSKKYNYCKIGTRINKLTLLNINPIPLSKHSKYDKLESLIYLSKEVAKKQYFY